jgi:hypothetical protein
LGTAFDIQNQCHEEHSQSLVVFWISNLICFIILSASTFREFKNYGVYESKQNLENLTSEIISIEAINNDHSQGNIELGDLRLGKMIN